MSWAVAYQSGQTKAISAFLAVGTLRMTAAEGKNKGRSTSSKSKAASYMSQQGQKRHDISSNAELIREVASSNFLPGLIIRSIRDRHIRPHQTPLLGTSIDRLQPYRVYVPNFLRPPFSPTSATRAGMRARRPCSQLDMALWTVCNVSLLIFSCFSQFTYTLLQ